MHALNEQTGVEYIMRCEAAPSICYKDDWFAWLCCISMSMQSLIICPSACRRVCGTWIALSRSVCVCAGSVVDILSNNRNKEYSSSRQAGFSRHESISSRWDRLHDFDFSLIYDLHYNYTRSSRNRNRSNITLRKLFEKTIEHRYGALIGVPKSVHYNRARLY